MLFYFHGEININLISLLLSIQAAPPRSIPPHFSVEITPIVHLQIQVKKHIMGDERMFERINVFTRANKLPWAEDIVPNNPPNYVSSYETDFYHKQIKPLLLLLRLLGALPIGIGKSGE